MAKDRYGRSLIGGSILVVLGFSIWLYADSVVSGLSQLITGSTTMEEMYRYYNAMRWWRLQQTSLLNPIAAVLILIGVLLIAYAFFYIAKLTVATRLKEES